MPQNLPPVNLATAAQSGEGSALAARDAKRGRSLGNNTKSQAGFRDAICPETGVVTRFALDPVRREYVSVTDADTAKRDSRNSRFTLQNAASKLLFNHETPKQTQWRCTGCHRRKISDHVTVCYSEAIKKAHFGNLMICGSVWTCPVCAAKISEKRKREISQATDIHKAAGGGLAMLTLTFSHSRNDLLKPMLKALNRATAWLRAHRSYKKLQKELGYIGHIRALEITFGDANGAHPHIHDLWLTQKPLSRVQQRHMHNVLFGLWFKACAAHGLGLPNRKRGVNVKDMESAAEYLAKFGREPKWGVASELSKQHVKKGRANRWSPFDLLRKYQDGDKAAGAAFIEYAEAFFGQQQIVWSRGLKALFSIAEKTDEQISQEQEQDAQVIERITSEEWKIILHRSIDQRAALLDIAETGGAVAVRLFLDALLVRPVKQTVLALDVVNLVPQKVSLPVRKNSVVFTSSGQIMMMDRAVQKEAQRFAVSRSLNAALRLSPEDYVIAKRNGLLPGVK